jgi:hypothetical protein
MVREELQEAGRTIDLQNRLERITAHSLQRAQEVPGRPANDKVDPTKLLQGLLDGGFERGELADVAGDGKTAGGRLFLEGGGGFLQDFLTATEDGGVGAVCEYKEGSARSRRREREGRRTDEPSSS